MHFAMDLVNINEPLCQDHKNWGCCQSMLEYTHDRPLKPIYQLAEWMRGSKCYDLVRHPNDARRRRKSTNPRPPKRRVKYGEQPHGEKPRATAPAAALDSSLKKILNLWEGTSEWEHAADRSIGLGFVSSSRRSHRVSTDMLQNIYNVLAAESLGYGNRCGLSGFVHLLAGKEPFRSIM